MAWIYLLFAGLFEVGWAIGLKYTDGFSRLIPTVWTVASMIVSLVLLGLALKTLPVAPAMRCGPASAQSARRSSASSFSASRPPRSGSPASG